MTINDEIREEKLQYGIKREASKISAISSGKIETWISYRLRNTTFTIKEEW